MPFFDAFISGAFAGSAALVATHPFDTVRVQIQNQREGQNKSAMDFWKANSLLKLYRGIPSPIVGAMVVNSVLFGVEKNVNENIGHFVEAHYSKKIVSGGFSGFITGMILTPIELVKIRMQTLESTHKNTWVCTRYIVENEGLFAITRGFLLTVSRETPACAIYFASNEFFKSLFDADNGYTGLKVFTAGGIAGCLSWIFTYPIDVFKTRFQANTNYNSISECIKETIKTGGSFSMARGLTVTIVRAFIYNGVAFFTEDFVRNSLFTDQ
jgi:solute carrier family 25 (mitochondrial carnitine/acylcarnitine transporter), member 20/29